MTYRGDISQLAAALGARGWTVETSGGNVLKLQSASNKPPALPPPPLPAQPQPLAVPQPTPVQPPGEPQ